jgi:hypothetical protein
VLDVILNNQWALMIIVTALLLPALIAIVILLIFDLTHSRQGVIGISQQPLVDLQQSMHPKP